VEAVIGQLGLGPWGTNLARNFNELARLKWLCDLDPGRGAGLASRFPSPRTRHSPSKHSRRSAATDASGVLVSTAGARVAVEISAVPLMSGERVVGVFGLFEGWPDDGPTAPPPHLTPRQVEVLGLLERDRSTKQMAAELHLSTETVSNHIRHLTWALGVNSRLEAVALARSRHLAANKRRLPGPVGAARQPTHIAGKPVSAQFIASA
jgi:DNA-binding CsgD family transcriptional regulator